jgi:hypothetical protein
MRADFYPVSRTSGKPSIVASSVSVRADCSLIACEALGTFALEEFEPDAHRRTARFDPAKAATPAHPQELS